jgi:hypothetical protein
VDDFISPSVLPDRFQIFRLYYCRWVSEAKTIIAVKFSGASASADLASQKNGRGMNDNRHLLGLNTAICARGR